MMTAHTQTALMYDTEYMINIHPLNAASPERKTLYVLLLILLSEGSFVTISFLAKPYEFIRYLGFASKHAGTITGWVIGIIVTITYVWRTAKIADVRYHLVRPSQLKAIAVVAAVMAAILEEVIFRRWVMDYVHAQGYGFILQILASGLTFGLVHLMWSAKNLAAGVNAVLATAILGCALGIVYIASNRSLAPCIAAHFVITALIEPGLILAAVKDKLGHWHEKSSKPGMG